VYIFKWSLRFVTLYDSSVGFKTSVFSENAIAIVSQEDDCKDDGYEPI